MTCKDLIDYLQRFPASDLVGVVVVDTKRRLRHKATGYDLLAEAPAILIETTESEPLDDIAEEANENG